MEKNDKAWIITADMGHGHQRAVWPLKHIANEKVLNCGIEYCDKSEKRLWKMFLASYETISKFADIPIISKISNKILEKILYIPSLYPIRRNSSATLQVKYLKFLIKRGLCKGFINRINSTPHQMPVISSFFAPILATDYHNYKGKIYCIICDSDLSRAWVSENPNISKMEFFAPCKRAERRLKTYGVSPEKIHLTGFPISNSLLGGKELSVLKKDLAKRLKILDPNNNFWSLHRTNVEHFLQRENCAQEKDRAITITYCVGGAGAQADIGEKIAIKMKKHIINGTININFSAGIKQPVIKRFEEFIEKELEKSANAKIIKGATKDEYFENFDACLHTTDVLWTKPSELSFYCGLGIPIMICPPIGPQECKNKNWLMEMQAGFPQKDLEGVEHWFFDLINDGRLAEAAWSGFLKGRKCGVLKIEEMIKTGKISTSDSPLLR